MDVSVSLPAEIRAVVGSGPTVERPFQGMAFETVILHSDRGRFVLKLGHSPRLAAELAAEQRVLVALAPHRPFVPEPLAFAVEAETGFSLLSYLPGRNGAELAREVDAAAAHALVAAYAWALRRVHSWQTALPQPADWLTRALDRVERHVLSGAVPNPIPHPGRWGGADPTQLVADLRTWRVTVANDLVFAHGDYCMPNILLQDGRVSGVIDWPEGGYADSRYDLATAAWSIRFNLEDESYVRTFLLAYGYDEPEETLAPFEALYVLT
jgi:aminoglycoside phosphotransferase